MFVGWDWSIFVGSVVKEEKPHGWNLPCYSTIQVACGCNGNHTCVALVWWVRRTAKSSQKAFECAESSAFFIKITVWPTLFTEFCGTHFFKASGLELRTVLQTMAAT